MLRVRLRFVERSRRELAPRPRRRRDSAATLGGGVAAPHLAAGTTPHPPSIVEGPSGASPGSHAARARFLKACSPTSPSEEATE
jgi:hypothetical protein